jgi:hypothetical protein
MTDPEAFVDAIREANQTPLSRLGSSKSLFAETSGEIETEPVLEATARVEHAAWQTFESWAGDESNEAVREFFNRVAAQEREHFKRVTDRLGAVVDPSDPASAIHGYLRERSESVERLGGFIGRTLASKRSKDQVVGYFVGDADPQTAQLFREFGEEPDEQLSEATSLLEELDLDEAGEERARAAASGAIEAAYAEYVESLQSMGINPKPVC